MNENPSNTTLIMFTASYPYGAVEESFIHKEVTYLSSAFNRIVIVPTSLPLGTERIQRELPKNIYIDDQLLVQQKTRIKMFFFTLKRILIALTSKHFYTEIMLIPRSILKFAAIKRIVGSLSGALLIRKWAVEYANQNKSSLSKTIFYTYWFNHATMGIGMVKKEYPMIKLVSRAHRGDLYEEHLDPPFIPYRYSTLSLIDRLYLISEHGYNYISKRYPIFHHKFEVARLGVMDPCFNVQSSQDGIFRIVSCSYVVPVKRIELIIQGLKVLGQKYPEEFFNWIHIGYGPSKKQLEDMATECLSSNISFNFMGYIPDVISFYQTHQVDLFINVSSSEGIPVSIMEAQSCGIPVIATAVGGTPEIVSRNVGLLLGKDPTPEEISDAIWDMKKDPYILGILKKNSKANWNMNYDAEKNYKKFSFDLLNL